MSNFVDYRIRCVTSDKNPMCLSQQETVTNRGATQQELIVLQPAGDPQPFDMNPESIQGFGIVVNINNNTPMTTRLLTLPSNLTTGEIVSGGQFSYSITINNTTAGIDVVDITPQAVGTPPPPNGTAIVNLNGTLIQSPATLTIPSQTVMSFQSRTPQEIASIGIQFGGGIGANYIASANTAIGAGIPILWHRVQ